MTKRKQDKRKSVIIKQYTALTDAYADRDRLLVVGINAALINEHTPIIMPPMQMFEPTSLVVLETDASRAREILGIEEE